MRTSQTLFVLGFLLVATVAAIGLVLIDGFDEEPGEQYETTSITPPEGMPAAVARSVRPGGAGSEVTGRLYLVLDDAGHRLDDLRRFDSFDGVFTLAVLPGLAGSADAAEWALQRGHEVILHQPMEATAGNALGPGGIYLGNSAETIRRVVRENLATVPGAVGVNNHMGSLATGSSELMTHLVHELASLHLYALDSRTTASSRLAETARVQGHPIVERQVFLDNERTGDAIDAQLDLALSIAAGEGSAIMIGHVTVGELAQVLSERYDEIVSRGFVFLPLSDAVVTELGGRANAGARN